VISDTAESLCPAHLSLRPGLSSRRYDLHQGRSWQQPGRGLLPDHSDCGKDVAETGAPEAQGHLGNVVHHVVVAQGHLTAAGRKSVYGRQIAFPLLDAICATVVGLALSCAVEEMSALLGGKFLHETISDSALVTWRSVMNTHDDDLHARLGRICNRGSRYKGFFSESPERRPERSIYRRWIAKPESLAARPLVFWPRPQRRLAATIRAWIGRRIRGRPRSPVGSPYQSSNHGGWCYLVRPPARLARESLSVGSRLRSQGSPGAPGADLGASLLWIAFEANKGAVCSGPIAQRVEPTYRCAVKTWIVWLIGRTR
jgi:hypothetical protein